MIHSILISGGNSPQRLEKALQIVEKFLGKKITNHPDFILIEAKDSIKIGQIRELQKKLAFKPYSALFKVALIDSAEKLTLPAQHSLLKILEEPPANSIIILTVQTKESLLPTIISRCQIVSLAEKPSIELDKATIQSQQLVIIEILKSTPGQRILFGEKYSQNRDQAKEFCQAQLITLREALLKSRYPQLTPAQIANILRQLQQSLQFLKANVNLHLVVGNLLLSYPKSVKI